MKKTIQHKVIPIIIATILLFLFLYWQNTDIVIMRIDYANKKVPSDFDGFAIVQISDLHNTLFGKDEKILLKKISALNPDIIVITGDIVDNQRTDTQTALAFIRNAVAIAPIYYVSGNHEERIDEYRMLMDGMASLGVIILDTKTVPIQKGLSAITIGGIPDPFFSPADMNLKALSIDDGKFNILLAHRPELIRLYEKAKFDLVFTGHAHGGQVRIPFTNIGLIAPDQGFFPKYTSGIYTINSLTEVVSRGLGNSAFPFRIFNRPEIIALTLHTSE
jgi:predicted MPP superfamily phosphohydrolase